MSGCPAFVSDLPSVLGFQSEEPEGRSYSTLTTVREIETQTELLSPGSGRAEEEEDRSELPCPPYDAARNGLLGGRAWPRVWPRWSKAVGSVGEDFTWLFPGPAES